MQIHKMATKFERGINTNGGIVGEAHARTKLFSSDVPKIRKFLRGDDSVQKIADEFGVAYLTMYDFIKRRALCDMGERRLRIGYKRNADLGGIE